MDQTETTYSPPKTVREMNRRQRNLLREIRYLITKFENQDLSVEENRSDLDQVRKAYKIVEGMGVEHTYLKHLYGDDPPRHLACGNARVEDLNGIHTVEQCLKKIAELNDGYIRTPSAAHLLIGAGKTDGNFTYVRSYINRIVRDRKKVRWDKIGQGLYRTPGVNHTDEQERQAIGRLLKAEEIARIEY